jgi:hypothetical protein
MRNEFVWKHCPDNLHGNVLYEQFLLTSLCMKLVSMAMPLCWQAAFQTSNVIAHSHDLAVPDYFLWDYVKSKVYKKHPANTDY